MKILQMIISKNTIQLLLFIPLLIVLHSCDEPEVKNEKTIRTDINSLNKKLSEIDNTLNLMDSAQQIINSIKNDLRHGLISNEDAAFKLNQVNNSIGREIAKTSNTNPVTKLPKWALQLGLTSAKNMTLDANYSQSTSENNPNEGFNSVVLVYKGTYDEAIKQAEIIAAKANIPMSQDYKDALILSREYNITSIKGASYMNFEFGSTNNPKYNISITVDEFGILIINATDSFALLKQLN